MNKLLKQILILACLIAILILPYFVFAQDTMKDILIKTGSEGGYLTTGVDEYTFSQILGTVVSAVIGLLGVVFIGLIIYAGYNWMIARGEEEKLNNAKDTLKRAVIGLVIVVGAYAIWNFVGGYLGITK
ncbi:pilin [Patescibacteria group bacterium]|nr:pilin [Patescibacteria group bacterium]MBU4600815.1 pilin [Patescibacteria group bacterium]MCG2697557.1 pilin [Candidatus Parcubacteria bacterium]